MKQHRKRNRYAVKTLLLTTAFAAVLSSCALSASADSTGQAEDSVQTDTNPVPVSASGDSRETSPVITVKSGQRSGTVIKGVPESVNRRMNEKISFQISVSPANKGRTVLLQRYKTSKKKWKTIRTYTTKDQDTASLKITIDKKYRKKASGNWRIRVKASDTAKSASSPSFTVITRNIEKVPVTARSACIYCADTGEMLYTKKAATRRAHASTTKIMTAVLLCESGKLKKTTKISKKAANTPWSGDWLTKNDRFKNMDLLYAMMLPSSNGASVAAAESVSGSVSAFLTKMNQKAEALGLNDTHYRNTHGLDEKKHYSTASDLAKLTAFAWQIPEIRKAWGTSEKTIKSLKKKRTVTLHSTDEILGYTSAFKGGKTGTTENAGFCFSGVYVWKGKTYVTTVLNSSLESTRWSDTKKLHSYIRKHAGTSY